MPPQIFHADATRADVYLMCRDTDKADVGSFMSCFWLREMSRGRRVQQFCLIHLRDSPHFISEIYLSTS